MSGAVHIQAWPCGDTAGIGRVGAGPEMAGGWSRRFTLGVALVGAPFVVFAGTLLLLAVSVEGRLAVGVLLPLLAAGFVLEVVLGTVGVFLVLTSPELRPWSREEPLET